MIVSTKINKDNLTKKTYPFINIKTEIVLTIN